MNNTRKPMPNMVRRVMCPQGARVVMVQQPSGYHIKPKQPIVMQRSKAVILGAKRPLTITPPPVTMEYVKSSPLPPSPPMDVLGNSDGESNGSSHEDEVDLELMNMMAMEDLLAANDDETKTNGGPPRKRERLTHLTPEEKMWRRKLKNRIAAQTARDRKKARMDDIEGDLNSMRAVNRRLLIDNQQLKKENEAMKQRLAQVEKQMIKIEEVDAFTPAAPISAPQPREQASPLTHVLTALLLSFLPPTANSTPSSPTSWPTMSKQIQALPLPQRRRLQRAVLKWHTKEAKLGRMKPRATTSVPASV